VLSHWIGVDMARTVAPSDPFMADHVDPIVHLHPFPCLAR
jgi:hypothetical protein